MVEDKNAHHCANTMIEIILCLQTLEFGEDRKDNLEEKKDEGKRQIDED